MGFEMVQMEEGDEPWLPCLRFHGAPDYEFGRAIGRRFQRMICSRSASDPALHSEMIPFAETEDGKTLVAALTAANQQQFPIYFDELCRTTDGAEVPFLQVLLINMKKEVAPFLASPIQREKVGKSDQFSTILLNTELLAVIAHNKDADISLLNHAYLVHAELESGLLFVAYTHAGELLSCAFGFNSHGVVFTLNAVPLAPGEAVAGKICCNFISRDLLEASNRLDALKRVCLLNRSVGHNYNIMDVNEGKMITVEAASKGRWSIKEIGAQPFLGVPVARSPWSTGLFSCFGNCGEHFTSDLQVCIPGSFTPCVLYGSNMERRVFMHHCMMYTYLWIVGANLLNMNLAPCISVGSRIALRRKYNLEIIGSRAWRFPTRFSGNVRVNLNYPGLDVAADGCGSLQQFTTSESCTIASVPKLWGGWTQTWNVAPSVFNTLPGLRHYPSPQLLQLRTHFRIPCK